jgi:HAD superfamily hydrolase (TIGR01549 family)
MDKLEPLAIIFDLGSTLIEYEQVPWDELGIHAVENGRKYLLSKGHDVSDNGEFLRQFDEIKFMYRKRAAEKLVEWTVQQATADMFEKIGLDHDEKLISGFFDAYYEPVESQLYVYDDTIETLERLKNRYPEMGLISNTIFPDWVHERELQRFGIAPYLDFKLFSSSFKLRKPHRDIFYKAANLAGHAPPECVYIGDRYEEDIKGPRSVGMPAILKIKGGREYPEDMPEADRRVETLSELVEHIKL